jgi:chorismate mutase
MTTMNTDPIEGMRRSINFIDHCIAEMLISRRQLSDEVQLAKRTAGLQVRDAAREAEITYRYEHTAPGLSTVSQAILAWCRL